MIWFGLLLLVLLCAGVVVALRLPPGATLLPLALLCTDCGPTALQVQAVAADTVGRAANAMLPAMVSTYRLEGDEMIARAKTADEARAGLETIRDRWRPVWAAWEVFAVAHDAYATALGQGTATPQLAAELGDAYCLLRAAVADRAELPDHPLQPCGVLP
jgi:hypothetical protein